MFFVTDVVCSGGGDSLGIFLLLIYGCVDVSIARQVGIVRRGSASSPSAEFGSRHTPTLDIEGFGFGFFNLMVPLGFSLPSFFDATLIVASSPGSQEPSQSHHVA